MIHLKKQNRKIYKNEAVSLTFFKHTGETALACYENSLKIHLTK